MQFFLRKVEEGVGLLSKFPFANPFGVFGFTSFPLSRTIVEFGLAFTLRILQRNRAHRGILQERIGAGSMMDRDMAQGRVQIIGRGEISEDERN